MKFHSRDDAELEMEQLDIELDWESLVASAELSWAHEEYLIAEGLIEKR